MTDANEMVLKVTEIAVGCLVCAMGSLIAAPFALILAAPFVIGW